MNLFPWWSSTFILSFTLLLVTLQGTTFTFVNRCNFTVWPAMSVDPDNGALNTSGFELPKESSRSFQIQVPPNLILNFQMWARTGCKVDQSGSWLCQTGDCGTGTVECNGNLYSKPFTVAHISLNQPPADEYGVSLRNGFNVPMNLVVVGGSGRCVSVGCNVDLNLLCPLELALKDGQGCMDPCNALGNSEYCCSGPYAYSIDCGLNIYSEIFEAACPWADSDDYHYCNGGDFVVTFCPSSSFSSSS